MIETEWMVCPHRRHVTSSTSGSRSHRTLVGYSMACCIILLISFTAGCALWQRPAVLPSDVSMRRGPLVFHCDHQLDNKSPIFDELNVLCRDMSMALDLPVGSRSVDVFLFSEPRAYQRYVRRYLPDYRDRRALFVGDQDTLRVLAPVTNELDVDLRHEIAHSCLHSAVPNVPLWLDEGLAEYYEVPAAQRANRRDHIKSLLDAQRRRAWHPDLKRLESFEQAADMGPLDYAESWLWAHYLLESSDESRRLLQSYLARVRQAEESLYFSSFAPLPSSELNNSVGRHLRQISPPS